MNGMASRTKASMLTGPVWKSLFFFAVPLLLGSIFQQLYNTVDSLVVGNFLGDSALAAVSSAANLINLLVDLFVGLFAGAGILVANTYGSGDRDKLSRAVQTTLSVGLAAGIFLTVIGNILGPAHSSPDEYTSRCDDKFARLFQSLFFRFACFYHV